MKQKMLIKALVFGSITVGSIADLNAWTRKPIDTARCQRDGKNMQVCQKENNEDNEYDFSALLSPQSLKAFNNFTPDQKRRAMDYADNNQMDPNAAVGKVAANQY